MKGIHLLSGPRNISTAMMYAFAHRESCDVIDEPFYAYYLRRTQKDHPGADEVMRVMPTEPEAIFSDLIFRQRSTDELFVKSMPHHMEGVDPMRLSQLTPVFLIRHPSLTIASFTKVIPDISMVDIAVREQAEMYDLLKSASTPIVVDSSNVLRDPERAMRLLCLQLDIPFQAGMLSWEPGALPQDGVWAKYWYANVHASSGLQKRTEHPVEVEPRYRSLLAEALEYYDYLKSFETI